LLATPAKFLQFVPGFLFLATSDLEVSAFALHFLSAAMDFGFESRKLGSLGQQLLLIAIQPGLQFGAALMFFFQLPGLLRELSQHGLAFAIQLLPGRQQAVSIHQELLAFRLQSRCIIVRFRLKLSSIRVELCVQAADLAAIDGQPGSFDIAVLAVAVVFRASSLQFVSRFGQSICFALQGGSMLIDGIQLSRELGRHPLVGGLPFLPDGLSLRMFFGQILPGCLGKAGNPPGFLCELLLTGLELRFALGHVCDLLLDSLCVLCHLVGALLQFLVAPTKQVWLFLRRMLKRLDDRLSRVVEFGQALLDFFQASFHQGIVSHRLTGRMSCLASLSFIDNRTAMTILQRFRRHDCRVTSFHRGGIMR
jgi:hypothetical protein